MTVRDGDNTPPVELSFMPLSGPSRVGPRAESKAKLDANKARTNNLTVYGEPKFGLFVEPFMPDRLSRNRGDYFFRGAEGDE